MTRRGAFRRWARSRGRGATARNVAFVALFAVVVLGCASPGAGTSEGSEGERVARGRALFESKGLSPSAMNLFRCVSCHDVTPRASGLLKPGAPLAGVTLRPTFWGGQEADLLHAVDDCRSLFMYASQPLEPGTADADALYDYLASLEPGDAATARFTVVRDIQNLARGDATRGTTTYAAACATCHGAMHTGTGQLSDRVPVLPEDTLLEHAAPGYTPRTQRLVFIEKTRHGLFLDYGGDMPPFSLEALPDADLADVLEALGVLGE